MNDLIIIGLGPAGITAAIYAKRSNLKTLVIERSTPGGALHNIDKIENYLGYETISGTDLAMKFYKQFRSLDIPMINEEVLDIKINKEDKVVITKNNEYHAKTIIIATGRGALKLNMPNDDLRGISYCVLCDGALYKNKITAIYGNNPKSLEDAIYLSNIADKVYLIVNQNKLIGQKELIEKVNKIENIETIFNSKITKINGNNQIESVNIADKEIKIDGLFINNDFGPLTSFCHNLNILDDKGYIIVNEKQETNIPGIFACGDSTKKAIYQVITSASEGASAAINAYKYAKDIK